MEERDGTCGELLCGDDYGERVLEFVKLTKDPITRISLLERLQELGLLSAFLAAESGTI